MHTHTHTHTHAHAHPPDPTKEMEEVREAFQLFDTEQKGSIDIKELKAGFRALGFQVKYRRDSRVRCIYHFQ